MLNFDLLLKAIVRQTVLCIGDLMLDEFVYGEVSRISPEAPVPVLTVRRSETNIGGAGNVARNVTSLGAHCIFISLIGDDITGSCLKGEFSDDPLIEAMLVVDRERPTTRKTRYVSEHFSTHMLRADAERTVPASGLIEQQLINAAVAALPRADVVLLSDYAKGVLTERVVRHVIDRARQLRKPVVVDPKNANFAFYRGATLLTPNRKEFSEATRRRIISADDIAEASIEALRTADAEAVLVTRSEDGMTLAHRNGDLFNVPALPSKVRDVSGAGDTVAAVVAIALGAKADWEDALRCATAAAAVAVSKPGTATVSLGELRQKLLPAASLAAEQKIVMSADMLAARLEEWQKEGQRVGFTNGCFDILHPGHVRVLTQARAACDRLIVGLNSDASVRRLKGPERPVQEEKARAEVLAVLEAVDLVVIFDEDTPLDLISKIRPRVLVKGGDYTREQVVGHEIVAAYGGDVVLVDILHGHSTTSLVRRAQEKRA